MITNQEVRPSLLHRRPEGGPTVPFEPGIAKTGSTAGNTG